MAMRATSSSRAKSFLGLSYDELKDAAPGSLTVKDGMAVIDHVRPQEP
jgi:hypothetical protein